MKKGTPYCHFHVVPINDYTDAVKKGLLYLETYSRRDNRNHRRYTESAARISSGAIASQALNA